MNSIISFEIDELVLSLSNKNDAIMDICGQTLGLLFKTALLSYFENTLSYNFLYNAAPELSNRRDIKLEASGDFPELGKYVIIRFLNSPNSCLKVFEPR